MLKSISQLGDRMTRMFGEPSQGVHSYSSSDEEKMENVFSGYIYANLLPYVAYDEESEIFIGKNSMGFTIQAVPLVGCDESQIKEMASLFDCEILEEGASLQFLLWADHRVDSFLKPWENSRRDADEIFRKISNKRAEFFRNNGKTSSRNFTFMLSYSVPLQGESDAEKIEALRTKKERILKTLSLMTYAFTWTAKHLLENVGGMVNFNLSPSFHKREWNPYQTIYSQIPTGGLLNVHADRLEWKMNGSEADFKSFRVIDYPSLWSPSAMHLLVGDMLRNSYRVQFPFYLHYGVHCPKQSSAESSYQKRSHLTEKQGKSHTLLRMIPELEEELRECTQVRKALLNGSRFVWTQFSAGLWASKEQMIEGEQQIKSLFRINNFTITENQYLHLPHFLSALPMAWAENVGSLKELNLLKTTLTSECTNFIPLQAEWSGTRTPGMLLIGRRGQLMNWNPFDNQTGNYNVAVVGRSGSGKSVFMQDLLLSGLGTGAKVFVLDVGRSFEKMCDSLGGQAIEFSKTSNICLNPFTHIPLDDKEEIDTELGFIKTVITCMATRDQGIEPYENGILELAVRETWNAKKNEASITDIADWLSHQKDERARTLGVILTPYTKNGIYGKYFDGKHNVDFKSAMVLIELEELKEKKDLQAVVLQLFIMTITNHAFLGDRKTPFYICIDEAWDLLRGKQTGLFIETLARRLRKYHGSLVIGTQSAEDFFTTPGAQAAFENSDWVCLLSQKMASISRLAESKKMDLGPQKMAALESLSSRHGEYSEILICDADGGYSVARLVLEPFSQLLYSTQATEYAQLKELRKNGLSIVEAIDNLILAREKAHQKKIV